MSEDVLPTPPATPSAPTPGLAAPSRAALRRTLDGLLERYLYLLDEQQKLHEELGKHMSAGFLSLARANQSCSPGRRYGEDYYDERMKAVRTIEITRHEASSTVAEQTEEEKKANLAENDKEETESTDLQDENALDDIKIPSFKVVASITSSHAPEKSPRPEESDEPEGSEESEESDEPEPEKPHTNSSTSKNNPASAPSDPLRWFGVLVPLPLRSAQGSFVSAVEGPIPRLASVLAQMREVERRVGDTRKTLEV